MFDLKDINGILGAIEELANQGRTIDRNGLPSKMCCLYAIRSLDAIGEKIVAAIRADKEKEKAEITTQPSPEPIKYNPKIGDCE